MNKILIILFLWIIYTSCANQGKDVSAFVLVEDEFNEKIIDSTLVSVIGEIIRTKTFSSDLYCITIEFLQKDIPSRRVTKRDTVIRFSYYASQVDYSNDGYKGIVVVDKYPVAIFDKADIGYNYYDESALIKYPLEKFKDIEIPAIFNGYAYARLFHYFKFKEGDLYNLYRRDSDNLYGL